MTSKFKYTCIYLICKNLILCDSDKCFHHINSLNKTTNSIFHEKYTANFNSSCNLSSTSQNDITLDCFDSNQQNIPATQIKILNDLKFNHTKNPLENFINNQKALKKDTIRNSRPDFVDENPLQKISHKNQLQSKLSDSLACQCSNNNNDLHSYSTSLQFDSNFFDTKLNFSNKYF